MIIKNQVCQDYQVFSSFQKKFKMNFEQVKWRVSCAIQNGNKLCHSNFVTFDAKKAKETLWTRLSGNTITETKIFDRLENLPGEEPPLTHGL